MKALLRLACLFIRALRFEWKMGRIARASRRFVQPRPFRREDFLVVPAPGGHHWISLDDRMPSPLEIPWDRETDKDIRESVGVPWKISVRPRGQSTNRRGPGRSCNWYSGLDTFEFRWSEFAEYATEFSPVIQALVGERTEVSIPIPAFVSAWKQADPKDQHEEGGRQFLYLGRLKIYAIPERIP